MVDRIVIENHDDDIESLVDFCEIVRTALNNKGCVSVTIEDDESNEVIALMANHNYAEQVVADALDNLGISAYVYLDNKEKQ